MSVIKLSASKSMLMLQLILTGFLIQTYAVSLWKATILRDSTKNILTDTAAMAASVPVPIPAIQINLNYYFCLSTARNMTDTTMNCLAPYMSFRAE